MKRNDMEMTLAEWVSTTHPDHLARRQFAALTRARDEQADINAKLLIEQLNLETRIDELRALCREAGDFLATRVTGAMHDKCTHDLCDVRRRAGRLLAKLREQGGEG